MAGGLAGVDKRMKIPRGWREGHVEDLQRKLAAAERRNDELTEGIRVNNEALAVMQRQRDEAESAISRYEVRVDQPSSRFQRFEQANGFFTIEHPDNWRTYASNSGFAVSMAPDGGVVDTGNGQQAMLYGVIVNHYTPFEGETALSLAMSSEASFCAMMRRTTFPMLTWGCSMK